MASSEQRFHQGGQRGPLRLVGGSRATRPAMPATVKVEDEELEFADDEDFVKAGGSELLFVRMQERKPMEMQTKIADTVLHS